jgi:hypothetical protein
MLCELRKNIKYSHEREICFGAEACVFLSDCVNLISFQFRTQQYLKKAARNSSLCAKNTQNKENK